MVKGQQVGVASQSDTRVQLIHAALFLFDSNGYPRTSVEDIVAKAKVTKGAFYHHFESKEEVLEIIHNVYVESQIELCTRIMSDGGNPREQLRELARATITNLNQYRAHVSVYMQDRRFLTGQRKKNVLEKRSEIDKLFNSIIEDGVRGGYFRSDVSPKLITFGIIGMYAWVINWWKPSGSLSLQQIADQYVDVLLDGLNKK
jgi:TetR/AcrR family transcriptional regulator, cholesterol catabolism regulator